MNRSLKRYFKKRNWTRKSWSDFKENLHHYLTPKEQASLPVKNELLTFEPVIQPNPSETLPVSRSLIQTLSREIRKGVHPHFFMFKQDPLIRGKKDRKTGYLQLYESGCEKQLILDLPKWANRFPYFHVENKELSPSGETWLLSIDFVGSRVYHLFLKSLYADDYREIKIPKKKMLQTSHLLANERVSTEQAIWLDEDRILYVTLNRYYNDSGLYLYNLKTQKHKRIFAGNTETFLLLNTVNSGLFLLISSVDYHSEEVYLMDVDTLKVSLFIPRKFSVTYPLIQHETGQWFVCKKDKGCDTIATTVDWKHWNILYENKNPEEQILEVKYEKEMWFFTLETLKGLCLYVFKCGQLTLIEKSFDYYGLRQVVDGRFIVHRNKYTCAYKPMAIVLDTLQVIAPHMEPLYQEEEIFIHPHLRVTLLYKKKKKGVRPCLLRGYGAYNTYEHPSESPYYYPLLERGFVVAIAHLRGGGEYGFKGYAEGRMLHKKNTFDDFIETAHYLIDQKWTTRDKLAIWGRSCGGLLVSAVLNQEPDLCQVALAGVPYVTPLESMTQNNPLGKVSQSELGNVSNPKVKQYIHSYAPLEHIQKEGKYPHLLIYSNRQDTLVPYQEPLAYYRAMKEVEVYRKGERDLSFHLDPRFGHVQGTLLRDKCDHYGMLFGYVLKHLKL
jgi:oligopeptidase B